MKFSQIRPSTPLLRRFFKDRTGASAIEFVMLVPLLFLLLAGTVDLGQGLTVKRKINQIASTSAEIVSMQSNWTKADLTTILSGVSSILEPYDLTGLSVLICLVEVDTKGSVKVVWSAAQGTAALSAGQPSPVDIPPEILEEETQIIVTRVQYKLDTVFSGLFESVSGLNGYSYDQYFFLRPRNSNTISYT